MKSGRIKIFIADDQELFRRGLVSLFEKEAQFEVVGSVEDGLQAVERIPLDIPDVIIMDIRMPVLDGVAACRRIKQMYPQIEILFLSGDRSENNMREAFEAGGRAYLSKDCDFDELLVAARKAARGDYYLSGPASQEMVADFVRPLVDAQRPGGLMTHRERELARLLADGYSTKEAADVLNISPKTAETHRASIMKKLNAKNVTDIVKYCIRNQITEP